MRRNRAVWLVAFAGVILVIAGPGMGRFSRQSLDSGVQGAGCAFQVGIREGRHQFRNGMGLYQTDDRHDRERWQARRLLGLVCLRPPENRIYMEGGFAGLECKAPWPG
jgi:hypothetical protein